MADGAVGQRNVAGKRINSTTAGIAASGTVSANSTVGQQNVARAGKDSTTVGVIAVGSSSCQGQVRKRKRAGRVGEIDDARVIIQQRSARAKASRHIRDFICKSQVIVICVACNDDIAGCRSIDRQCFIDHQFALKQSDDIGSAAAEYCGSEGDCVGTVGVVAGDRGFA